MLLKYFYDQALAHASYLVGCQRSKTAVVVDPGRDVNQYLEAAKHEGLKLVGVAETHIHADYVSGAREIADRVGAKLYVSDEGPADWKYEYANAYDAQLLKDGDEFFVGNVKLTVIHTPGHTPESISFILTDQGGGANKPMGIFTGDFVFVGSIGRPDLLEEAAGIQGSAESGAHELFHSVERFKQLPDYMQIWPAHGAGSACGKGLGAIPSSTVGYEKMFNPALQYDSEDEFVRYILSDQPEAPKYFTVMKRVNKEGPQLIGNAGLPQMLDVGVLKSITDEATLLDLSPSMLFAGGHVPGSLNIPLSMLASWAGWLLDYSKPVYLLGDTAAIPEAVRVLQKIGVDAIAGVIDASRVRADGFATGRYATALPSVLAGKIESGDVQLVDVRNDREWNAGHIEQAKHLFLGRLTNHFHDLDRELPIVTQCQAGARSAIAASVLQTAGFSVIDMTGGYDAWISAGLPTVTERAVAREESLRT